VGMRYNYLLEFEKKGTSLFLHTCKLVLPNCKQIVAIHHISITLP
jgi:hypothetical protein